jgi:hypothetical protein
MRVPTNWSTLGSTVAFGDDRDGVIRRGLVFSSLPSRMAERDVRLQRWDACGEVSVGGVPDGDSGMMFGVEWWRHQHQPSLLQCVVVVVALVSKNAYPGGWAKMRLHSQGVMGSRHFW